MDGLLRETSEHPEVVGENAPRAEPGFVCVAPFADGVAEEAVHDDRNACFGLGAPCLMGTKDFVVQTFVEVFDVSGANVVFYFVCEPFGVGGAVKTAVAGEAFQWDAVFFFHAFEMFGNHSAVGGCLVFVQLPINDEPVRLFGEKQGVAEFDFGAGFAAHNDVHVGFVEAEDFLVVFDAAFADDAFVGLLR